MQNRDYYIDKDGFRLHAKLEFPQSQEKKMPLLIIIHGLTGQMDETHLEGVKDVALELGYACLRVDMYGHGKSDGDFVNHNIMEWVCEIIYIIDYARSLEFTTDVYLAGHSQGGLSVILAAGLKADQIKALIPMSPATNIVYDSCKGEFFGSIFDVENVPETVHFWDEYDLKGNYFRVARSLDVEGAIDAYDGPVLVVHGTNDESVPVSYGEEVAKRYRNATLKLVEGDSHCFDYHLDDMLAAVREFLANVR